MYDNEWYKIPGYTSYDINRITKDIRSHKHYKEDLYHIMKVYEGNVIIATDDAGVSRRAKVEELYDRTFNRGYPLYKRETGEVYKSGMLKEMRYMMGDVNYTNNSYTPEIDKYQETGEIRRVNLYPGKEKTTPIDLPYKNIVSEQYNDGSITLDFSKITSSNKPKMVKLFTINLSKN